MASNYLSINMGQLDNSLGNVLVATSLPTADFIFTTLTTHTPTRKDQLRALESFRNYILNAGVSGGQKGTDLPPL